MNSAGARFARAFFWAATWGVGVAIGVALGGWLTVVGGAGTPGVEALDLTQDVVVLPAIAGSIVLVIHLLGQGIVALVHRTRAPRGPDSDDQDSEQPEDEDI